MRKKTERDQPVIRAGLILVSALALLLGLMLGVAWFIDPSAPGILVAAIGEAVRDAEMAPAILKEGAVDFLTAVFGLGPGGREFVSMQLTIATIVTVFALLFALTSVLERKILARIQNRYGPNRVGPWGLLQPAADGIKMLIKEDIVPLGGDRVVHLLAPIIMVVPAFLALAILPYGPGLVPVELEVGILFFFAIGATTEVAVFMAGWGSNNKYSLLGAMRAIAQMISYELPLILAAIAIVMMTGSLSPAAIVDAQQGYSLGILPNWFALTPWGFGAFILFCIAAQAESNRSPFDLPEGESELVAGHMTEYSGFKYAVFFLAEYIGLFAICGIAVTLFLGGWRAPFPFLEFVPGYLWFFAKLYGLVLLSIWVRGTVPRVRIDQLMSFAWKFMTPMGFAVIVGAAIWHAAGRGPVGWVASAVPVLAAYLLLGRTLLAGYTPSGRVYRFSEG